MNDEILSLIREKNKFYKLKRKYINNLYFENKYRNFKIRLRNKINNARKEFYGSRIEENIGSSTKTWKVLNQLVYGQNNTNFSNIAKIVDNDNEVTNPVEIAEVFNDYFINIIDTPDHFQYSPEPVTRLLHPFVLDQCDTEEVRHAISSLNPKSANGPDGISAKLIQKYKAELSGPLSYFINECFSSGQYPEVLKIGSVVPIHKSGSKEVCTNYRPITKLSTVDKVFESILLNRLKTFIKTNDIISDNQFGFTENSSTMSACISCTEFLYENLDKRNMLLCWQST